jgi:hypothetical protein
VAVIEVVGPPSADADPSVVVTGPKVTGPSSCGTPVEHPATQPMAITTLSPNPMRMP